MNRRAHRYAPQGSFLEQPKFRPEVQGLRSLAVLLVVAYHVWFGRVSGGVDVFLFISAFLLSLSSLRKIQAGKPLKIVGYWLHVFQRLLPAAATVIVATLAASYFIIAPSRWSSLLADAKAALFYFLNWRLALNSVDYYAQDATTKTPFQHFWSLSMQGQIFILWPLLFAFVAFLVGYLRLKVLPTALLVFGSVFVASLTFSIIETYSNQSFAYFDTRTRLWEFAAGTLLAMLVLAWRAPSWLKVPMGWVGVIGLITCGWLLPVQQAFPGYLALWPLLSGAFVIAAGQTGSRFGVDRILSAKPLQKMGAISYCLYLVHWPVLILYTTYVGKEHAGWVDGALVIIASIGLAWLLHNVVEKPLRAWEKKPNRRVLTNTTIPWATTKTQTVKGSWVRPVAVIAVCLTLVGGSVTTAQAWARYQYNKQIELAEMAGSDDFPGARALTETFTSYRYDPIPSIEPLGQYDGASTPCAGAFATFNPQLAGNCYYEQYGSDDAPLTMIIGASHSGQSVAMWRHIARETETNFVDMHLGSCRFPEEPNPSEDCAFLNATVVDEILDVHPQTVLLMATVTDPGSNQEILMPGIEPQIQRLTDAGINVVALRDNPRFTYNVYECAQMNADDPNICGAPVADKLAPVNPANVLGDNPRVYLADMTESYCPNGYCQAVIGNIYVYMDDNHISRAYGKTVGPALLEQLAAQGWSPAAPTVDIQD